MKIFLEDGECFDAKCLESEEWLSYLYYTENHGISMEHVKVVEQVSGRETLSYVLRTLKLLKKEYEAGTINAEEYALLRPALEWAEVSKGGSVKERQKWRERGYALDIHNLASADIFLEHCREREEHAELIAIMIRTHGLIGQALRGEVPVRENTALIQIKEALGEESAYCVIRTLNRCIIGGVEEELWERVEKEAQSLIRRILVGDLTEFSTADRMIRLDKRLENASESFAELFEKQIFPNYELWYYQSAFSDFSIDQVEWLLRKMMEKMEEGVRYLSFKPLADGMYYDYQGRKHLNLYKERIVEKYMRDASVENVELVVEKNGRAMLVDFRFSTVCEKLIDFCVEAERCGLLTFEKSITVLYDMFGFRRDEFDRLNNESKYLSTMNDIEESTKNSIIAYAVGEKIVDVGSGGGVLLDLLERKYPQKEIIGTDISDNVLRVLEEKRCNEKHGWTVKRHNFTDGPYPEKVDSIFFSSILHEIYSYTETENGRFEIESVKKALQNAYASLNPGGRIVIRDGVKSADDTVIEITFHDPEGMDFFKNYMRDFEGLKDIEDRKIKIYESENRVCACTNFAREFLYTYTWGRESYAHEVQEQFGYFTIEEYREFFETLGAKIIRCESFLEQGYVSHLESKVTLSPDRFPDSNCIIVAEKR